MGDTRLFRKEDIRIFDIRNLHEKTLKISVAENAGWLLVVGQDIDDGKVYVIQEIKK